jgi:PAS domain S-box-containing protein
MKRSESANSGAPSESPDEGDGVASPCATELDLLTLQARVLNGLTDAISVSDERGYILYANNAEERLFGYSPGELTGKHVSLQDASSPHEGAERAAQVTEALQREGKWVGKWRNRRRDGSEFCSHTRISAIEAGDRTFRVSLRSQVADEARRELDYQNWPAVVECSDDAIITKDLNGTITGWNRGAERIFGYTAAEAVGQPVNILAPPNRVSEVPDILRRLRAGEQIEHYETERRTKDGRVISISLTVSPIRDSNGEIIGASKIARDITESKRLRNEIALREQRHANLLANLPDIIMQVRPDLRITYISEAIKRATGYSPERFIGITLDDAGFPTEPAQYLQSELQQVFETGQQRTISFRLPNPFSEVHEYIGVALPEYTNGEVVTALTIARDVTELTRAEQTQRAIQSELMLLVEASSALIASPRSSEVLQSILELARRFISADAYGVWRKQTAETFQLMSSSGLSERYLTEASTISLPAPPMEEPLFVEDVFSDPSLANRREFYLREGICSMLVVPLSIRGAFNGTVVYYWRRSKSPSTADLRIGTALGNLAAAALGTADSYEEETRSRQRAEALEARSRFLARAGALLSSSLDYEVTLKNVAQLAVPDFADWCSVDVADNWGQLERVAVRHRDPAMLKLSDEYREKFPARPEDATQVVLRTGKSLLVPELSDEMLAQSSRGPEYEELLHKLGLRSVIIAPLLAGNESLGIMSFVTAESGRRFGPQDLEIAEELGRRAGTAISHARLYAHLRESEERLQLAVNAAKLGVWERDQQTGVLMCSQQTRLNIGLPADEDLTYESLLQRIHPGDRRRWRHAVRAALESRSVFDLEVRVLTPEGDQKWVLACGQAIYSSEGKPVRTVGVTLDITERRNLLLREQQARRTAELLNGIGPVLLSELDPKHLVDRVIGIATELVGAEHGILFYRFQNGEANSLLHSFSGVERRAFEMMSPQKRADLIDSWSSCKKIMRTPDLTQLEHFQSPFAGLVANPIHSFLCVPVRSRTGQVLGGLLFGHKQVGMFNELHEEIVTGIAAQASIALENAHLFERAKRTEEALRTSNRDLRRANEDLNQFAYSASHDLQEPLRMVAIYSQLLAQRYEHQLDERGQEFLRFTFQGAKRMQMLVKDLLAYTQAGSGDAATVQPVNSGVVLKQAVLNLQSSIQENGAEVVYGEMPLLAVHEVHLLQLFQNLIGNALKYRKRHETPRIAISASRASDGFIEIRIADNGIGIAPRYHKQVFGLFKRLHTNDMYSGTGIGLALCQRIVDRYGGRIWVESEEGQGAIFYFTLPAAESQAEVIGPTVGSAE